jgi:hypothetical protein
MIIMQAATEAAPSSMVSVIGLNSDKITAIRNAANDEVSEDEKVQIANFLYPVSWPIYVFCCFSFYLWCCSRYHQHICQDLCLCTFKEHCSLAASMNLVRKFSVLIIQLLKWNKNVMLIMLLSQFDTETMQG